MCDMRIQLATFKFGESFFFFFFFLIFLLRNKYIQEKRNVVLTQKQTINYEFSY